ncbi:MAG: glycosyltransferase family 2 protein [Prevotella sp.]|nr:glycosyltransferase family 2 protein [Prevotella sp.]
MRTQLSILMPTFNDDCCESVMELARQALEIKELQFEILIGDDGSDNAEIAARNSQCTAIHTCRYIRKNENIGRAAIRNLLAREARFDWLLFVDSGMGIIRNDFIKTYLTTDDEPVYGGYVVSTDEHEKLQSNLRYLYEMAAAEQHKAGNRAKRPNHDFHTSNFLVSRSLFLKHPLDERFRQYGYEDVFWGKQLSEAGIAIHHIANPIAFDRFETNEKFLDKTEEGLRTLHQFRDELDGYSRLLKSAKIVEKLHLKKLCAKFFAQKQQEWRKNLCGSPSLRLFKYYKLFYLLSL